MSYSTIEDVGAGFRARTMLSRWSEIKDRLRHIDVPGMPPIDARILIGKVERDRVILGMQGPSFVIETRIPLDKFKQQSIGEKNEEILATIRESVRIAFAHFRIEMPEQVESAWAAKL